MKDKPLFRRMSVVLLLIAFSALLLSACTKSSNGDDADVVPTGSETAYTETEKDNDTTEKNGTVSQSLTDGTKNTDNSASKNNAVSVSEQTTNTPALDPENFKPDEQAGVSLRSIIVDGVFRLESIGESDGVLCITVKNVSGKDIEYCELKCKIGSEEALFTFSVLPKNASSTAFEKNKLKYKKDMAFSSWSVENVITFEQGLDLKNDIFDVRCEADYIEIKNTTKNDIDGKIKICYKNMTAENVYGNYAYTISVDGLKSGESKQLYPKHLDPGNCTVMYVKYDQ